MKRIAIATLLLTTPALAQNIKLLPLAIAGTSRLIEVPLAEDGASKIVQAHDSWINQGGYRNQAGEWCCGEKDCEALPHGTVHEVTGGYRVEFARGGIKSEFIPFKEAQPSPDGEFWRCHRADGQRICFFAPSPNT